MFILKGFLSEVRSGEMADKNINNGLLISKTAVTVLVNSKEKQDSRIFVVTFLMRMGVSFPRLLFFYQLH